MFASMSLQWSTCKTNTDKIHSKLDYSGDAMILTISMYELELIYIVQ